MIQFVRHSHDATMPKRATKYSAGYDLCTSESGVIQPGEKAIVSTGISMRLPESNLYGSIRSRSGLSVKNDIEVGAGVIDYDYKGVIKVILRNLGKKEFEYCVGDRIAQIVIEEYHSYECEEVEEFAEIIDDNRVGGFGSTGV